MSQQNWSCILLVDDEQMILDDFSQMFSDYFGRVLIANNGRNALEVAKTENVSIIISDISMPQMKGDEFLRNLRASGKETPVIFLTGFGSRDVVLSALRLGASDVLEKPILFDDLLASVSRVLEIERRKGVIADLETTGNSEQAAKEKKMMGLLQVAQDKSGKKAAS